MRQTHHVSSHSSFPGLCHGAGGWDETLALDGCRLEPKWPQATPSSSPMNPRPTSPMVRKINQTDKQTIIQPIKKIKQSINQASKQTNKQSNNQSINEPTNQTIKQTNKQTNKQTIKQSINQSNNQINQSINLKVQYARTRCFLEPNMNTRL